MNVLRLIIDNQEREEHKEQFPHSNIRVILNKVAAKTGDKFKAVMAQLMGEDPSDGGAVRESVFRGVLDHWLGYELTEHEVITLVRRYRAPPPPPANLDQQRILALLQADLRRDNFSQFDKVSSQ